MIDINITWEGVKKLIGGLDSRKSPGPDDMRPKLLKLVPIEAASFLNLIFENSLRASEVSVDWKVAKIAPLYKKASRSNPSNSRSMLLTSVPCNFLGHIIKPALYSHLERCSLSTDRQYGFRKNHSYTIQLLSIVNILCHAVTSRGQSDSIFFDFSKAFTKFSHCKHLQKLKLYGIW